MAPYYMSRPKTKNSRLRNLFVVGMPWQTTMSNDEVPFLNDTDRNNAMTFANSQTFLESDILSPYPVTCKGTGTASYSNNYNCAVTRPPDFPKSVRRLAYTKTFELEFADGGNECGKYASMEDNLDSCVIDMHEAVFNEGFKHEKDNKEELLEFYLKLPKDIFPPAKAISLSPNPMIHEFCLLVDVYKHCQWILDLEFGRRRYPTNMPIPRYNIALNNITCWSAPEFIHPAFEKCSVSFKRTLLFYYEYIYSVWHKGYSQVYNDNSLVNFKSWMSIPCYAYGMCWP